MTTRAGTAALNLRAKQELVRLLCLGQNTRYSYQELRTAYLKRIQKLHPDKQQQKQRPRNIRTKEQFVILQQAWQKYEKLAKQTNLHNNNNSNNGNFTLFGVGCSFSDSDIEREKRTKIMDQAGKGWFPAGELTTTTTEDTNKTTSQSTLPHKTTTTHSGREYSHPPSPLIESSMFEQTSDMCNNRFSSSRRNLRPSLVSHMIRPKRRGR